MDMSGVEQKNRALHQVENGEQGIAGYPEVVLPLLRRHTSARWERRWMGILFENLSSQQPFAIPTQTVLAKISTVPFYRRRNSDEPLANACSLPATASKSRVMERRASSAHAGEYEHGNALLTSRFADPIREAIGGAKSWVPSTGKRGAPGVAIDIPLAHKDALYVRSHYDTITASFGDAPAPDEIVIVFAVATRGRPNARVGGLSAAEVKGMDGLT